MRLAAVRLFVHEIEAARDFYRDVLGLRLEGDGSAQGYCVFESQGIQLIVEVVPRDAPAHDLEMVGRFSGVSFAVEDIAAEHRRLAEAGVEFAAVPERQAWGGTTAAFHDPAGNELTLVQYPAWGNEKMQRPVPAP